MTFRNNRRRQIGALALAGLLIAIPAYTLLPTGGASEVTQLLVLAENAVTALETAQTVLELEDQLTHMRDKALGQVGALVERFAQLSSDPMNLLADSSSIAWGGDFTGDPALLLTAVTEMQDPSATSVTDYWRQYLAGADTVDDTRIAQILRNVPNARFAGDAWLAQRELADRARIFDYTSLDNAERLIELLGTASDSVGRSRGQTNLSDTALAQEQLANQITGAEIDIAVAQLLAHQAVRDAMERQTFELLRRRQLEAWTASVTAQNQRVDRFSNRVRRRARAYNDSLLLN